jgi:hypothetical protein
MLMFRLSSYVSFGNTYLVAMATHTYEIHSKKAFCFVYLEKKLGSCIILLRTYTNNKQNINKFCHGKIFLLRKSHFCDFQKLAWQIFFIFCLLLVYVLSKMMHEKKLGVTELFFQLHKAIGFFRVNFLCVCCHSNELCVIKTDIIWKTKHQNRWTSWYLRHKT